MEAEDQRHSTNSIQLPGLAYKQSFGPAQSVLSKSLAGQGKSVISFALWVREAEFGAKNRVDTRRTWRIEKMRSVTVAVVRRGRVERCCLRVERRLDLIINFASEIVRELTWGGLLDMIARIRLKW